MSFPSRGLLLCSMLLIITSFVHARTKWLVPDQSHPGRFVNMTFPIRDLWFLEGRVFQRNLLVAPKTYYARFSAGTDFCLDGKSNLVNQFPMIWNNSDITYPCREYFCSQNSSKYMPQNGSDENILSLLDLYNNSYVLQGMAYNWCIKCQGSVNERFDLFVQNNTCPYFDKNICTNATCGADRTCVYFNSRGPLCYTPDDVFMTGAGYFEYFYLRLLVWGLPYVYFGVNLILLVINILFTVVPEIASLKRHFTLGSLTTIEKIRAICGLRNQCMAIEVFINCCFIVCGFIDIINFIPANNLSMTPCLYFHFAAILYSWSLLIILWIHLYTQPYKAI
jgi:hypothetical protein